MDTTFQRIQKSVQHLFGFYKQSGSPLIGITLGSGQGQVLKNAGVMEVQTAIPYRVIPHFKTPTVAGHSGELQFGTINHVPVVVLSGRVHFYEGHDMCDVVHAVRVLGMLGVQHMLLTNAAGGIRPDLKVGDLMVINDHMNKMGTCPLYGRNIDQLGPRFPAMANPYPHWKIISNVRNMQQISGATGVYAAMRGPCYETEAETQDLRLNGADAVGMSTAPEAIALRHMGISCGAISVITNAAGMEGLDHADVKTAADKAGGNLARLIQATVTQLNLLSKS